MKRARREIQFRLPPFARGGVKNFRGIRPSRNTDFDFRRYYRNNQITYNVNIG